MQFTPVNSARSFYTKHLLTLFKMLLRCFYSCLFVCLMAQVGKGQILDDSTKQIYGPKTTGYVLQDDFIYNRYKRTNTDTSWSIMAAPHTIDTSLNNFHSYNFINRQNNIYQDLGNLGTPLQPIFFQAPTEIGKTLGFNVFNPYAIDPLKIKYYDTKSPYTNLYYVQGSKGQQLLEVEHARNIKYNWSTGFSFRRMVSQKVVGAITPTNQSAGKRLQASDYTFSFYTRYYTKNERYQLMFNFTHMHHTNYDIGGIQKDYAHDTIFLYDKERINLFGARSIDRRVNYHLYHEYSLNERKTMQLYHEGDFQKRTNRYNDVLNVGAARSPDYPFYTTHAFGKDTLNGAQFRFSNLFLNDRVDYKLLENKIGMKGNIGALTYRVYFRRKDFSYKQLSYSINKDSIPGVKEGGNDAHPVDRVMSENFIGGSMAYFFKDSAYFKAEAEYLHSGSPANAVNTMHDYRLNLKYFYKYFDAGYNIVRYSPTLVQQQYRGNIAEWNNTYSNQHFKQTLASQLFAGLTLKTGNFSISPRVDYNSVDNFIYYDTSALPRQTPYNMSFLSGEILVKARLAWFHFELFGKYTNESGVHLWRVPGIFNHNRVYFQNFLFKKATMIQLGVDSYWKSGYNAYKYMPVTQQFYLNENFSVKNYMLLDVFLNVDLKNVRIFLRVSNVAQPAKLGYYITPYYSGLPRMFEFGLNWKFYN